MIYLSSKYSLLWYDIKGTLTLLFILLPEFSLFFWDRAVLCFAWDNSWASGGFWDLQLFTGRWSSAPINTVLLWGASLGEGRSQTKPFLAFTTSFHESWCCCRDTRSILPHGSQQWEVSAVTSPTEDHGNKMVTSLLATAFPNFSSSCVPLLLQRIQVWVVACTTEKVTSPEQRWGQTAGKSFVFFYKKSTSGACLVLSPLLGFPTCLSCQMANQLCGHAPDYVQKPAMDMGMIGFPQDFFFFPKNWQE